MLMDECFDRFIEGFLFEKEFPLKSATNKTFCTFFCVIVGEDSIFHGDIIVTAFIFFTITKTAFVFWQWMAIE